MDMKVSHNSEFLRGSGICRSPSVEPTWVSIGEPKIIPSSGKTRVSSDLEIDGEVFPLWFEVEKKYEDFLVADRVDAFLVGILNLAMRERWNIRSAIPATDTLLENLCKAFLPVLCSRNPKFYLPKIDCPSIAPVQKNFGAVGTGISCGVDSLHVLAKHGKGVGEKRFQVTHLVNNDVWPSDSNGRKRHADQVAFVKAFADENGYEFVGIDSNIYEHFFQNHSFAHTYVNFACVLALQKLWKVYYYASSGYGPKVAVDVDSIEYADSAHYDLLSCFSFSTENLIFFSEGVELTRFEKTKDLVFFEPAWKWLNVCGEDLGRNCGRCGKCRRTLATFDALEFSLGGVLERFSQSFDIDSYMENRKSMRRWCVLNGILGRELLGDAPKILAKTLSWGDWVMIFFQLPSAFFIPLIRARLAKNVFLRVLYKNFKKRT